MLAIEQKRLLKPKQILRLTDDGFLSLTVERLLSQREFKLDLQDFRPESSWQKVFPKRPFFAGIFFGGLALVTTVLALLTKNSGERVALFEAAITLFCCLVASAAWFWLTRSEFIAYFHRFSGEALVIIYTDIPDAPSVERFIRALDARLVGIHRPRPAISQVPLRLSGSSGSDSRSSLN
jgi:hypothetical protein